MSTNPMQEIIDTTQESDREGHSSVSEAEHSGHLPDAPQASSSKHKKKKKSKAARSLDSVRGNEIQLSLADHVVSGGQTEQGGGVVSPDAEAVMQALNHLKLMDALKGKTSITARGKNTLGEHKVWGHACPHSIIIPYDHASQVLGNSTRPSIG